MPGEASERDAGATPVIAQYLDIKDRYPDALLFFRMGDFYELFFDDAGKAAAALHIALTKRGRHRGEDIPMCGVPVERADGYLARLVQHGFKVAICEQVEAPEEARKRGSKSVVRRDVVRVVTAGTLTEDSLLDARRNNYLVAVAQAGGSAALAWLDISTGSFATEGLQPAGIAGALARLAPGEVLIGDGTEAARTVDAVAAEATFAVTRVPAQSFERTAGENRLKKLFGVASLDAFGPFDAAELCAAGALVGYVDLTQRGRLPPLSPPRRCSAASVMEIDAATRRNLEIGETQGGDRAGSLLGVIDRTLTAAGARLLQARLIAPLTEPDAIAARLDEVSCFADDDRLCERVRGELGGLPDIERLLARLSLGRGGPRDLAGVQAALDRAWHLKEILLAATGPAAPAPAGGLAADLGDHRALTAEVRTALADELPAGLRDGGFIAAGHDAALDALRRLRDDSRRVIAELEARYRQETGVAALKIRYSSQTGYCIEVPAKFADTLRTQPGLPFSQRQTLVNAVRFVTLELSELEGRIARARDDAIRLENTIFERLVAALVAAAEPVRRTAAAVAAIDVAAALARLAVDEGWCRPIVDDTTDLAITGGRHPVVEAKRAKDGGGRFVANDIALGETSRIWLLTGPNMAGKSTFLRQNALLAILAQAGSFVPAAAARIGVVDRLFSRIGAADDIARGRSTFMVEMVEAAAILHQATGRSLVILDEIGRGTATFDGLSIAWAVVEHLHEVNRCRALFATHYHELTVLGGRLPGLACHTMAVREWRGDVVFLHEVVAGTADRSYGIHVGRLAGLPAAVVRRAEEVLGLLESDRRTSAAAGLAEDLPLFRAALQPPPPSPEPSAVEDLLRTVEPDTLSPRDALDLVYRLKALLAAGPRSR